MSSKAGGRSGTTTAGERPKVQAAAEVELHTDKADLGDANGLGERLEGSRSRRGNLLHFLLRRLDTCWFHTTGNMRIVFV